MRRRGSEGFLGTPVNIHAPVCSQSLYKPIIPLVLLNLFFSLKPSQIVSVSTLAPIISVLFNFGIIQLSFLFSYHRARLLSSHSLFLRNLRQWPAIPIPSPPTCLMALLKTSVYRGALAQKTNWLVIPSDWKGIQLPSKLLQSTWLITVSRVLGKKAVE